MNLGAVFAAGHGPREVGEWTWDQVSLVSRGIQLYHLDLATRIATGKSAVAEEAAQAGGGSVAVRPDRAWMHRKPDEVSEAEKERIAAAELEELRRFVGGPGAMHDGVGNQGTIAVTFTGGAPKAAG